MGSKWWILLATIVVSFISSLVEGALEVPAAFMLEDGSGLTPLMFGSFMLSGLGTALGSVISAAFAASIYFELRRIKEGIGADRIAAVFD